MALPLAQTATFDSSGVASVAFTPSTYSGAGVGTSIGWAVLAVSVETTSTSQTIAKVTVSGWLVAGSHTGNLDTADGSPIMVAPSETLTVTWTGGTPGASATATVWYLPGGRS